MCLGKTPKHVVSLVGTIIVHLNLMLPTDTIIWQKVIVTDNTFWVLCTLSFLLCQYFLQTHQGIDG